MNINAAGVQIIKEFEGLRLTSYQDQVGVWTIGYGDTGPNIGPGMTITETQAETMLLCRLQKFEQGVTSLVKTPVNSNEFSALVVFSYNVGLGALEHSTLLRKLNAGDKDGAAAEFMKWNKAGGVENEGLTRRRTAERDLFLTPCPDESTDVSLDDIENQNM